MNKSFTAMIRAVGGWSRVVYALADKGGTEYVQTWKFPSVPLGY
jgi:hypothetical protein